MNFRNQRLGGHQVADYTKHSGSRVIMSCVTAVHDFKGNNVKFARFVLLAASGDAKATNKTVIRFGF